MFDKHILLTTSAVTTTVSTASAFSGDNVMAWVVLAINVLTLLSNAALAIYKNWRDRDKDGDVK
jgi:hypothetical protein